MKSATIGLILVLLGSAMPSQAEVFTKTFDFSARNFAFFDPEFPPPFNVVTGSFTLTADAEQTVFNSTSIVLNSLNVPLDREIVFTYYSFSPGQWALSVGGAASGALNILAPFGQKQTFDWRIDILHPFSNPTGDGFVYAVPPQGRSYSARDITVGDAASVPEPTSWVLMVCGMGIVGIMIRRRRQSAAKAIVHPTC